MKALKRKWSVVYFVKTKSRKAGSKTNVDLGHGMMQLLADVDISLMGWVVAIAGSFLLGVA